MDKSNSAVPVADIRIARTEADRLLLGGDCLLYRSGVELTLAQSEECEDPIAIQREHHLVFGNGLRISALRPQHPAFGVMRDSALGRGSQGLSG